MVVENTKRMGNQIVNKYNDLAEGDLVSVKSTLRIKIRLDGTRLIIPPLENHRHSKYTFKARINKIKGNCYNLTWL
jgi:hypothetical protein